MGMIFFGICIALLIALIAVRSMIAQMKPVAQKREASAYTAQQSVKLTVQEDRYLRTDVTRRRIGNGRSGGPGMSAPGGPRPGMR